MNTPINDGGPAFPITPEQYDGSALRGMSLRDVFAKEAMHAILLASLQGHCYHKAGKALGPNDYAKAAYENADAMLAARDQQPSKP